MKQSDSPTPTSSGRGDSNELRVFISSTFLDMQPEREYLLKQIFPELRQTCRERGITFTEVDLRWGITGRQARRKKIVSTCLDEIHRHRPFIIGLIGDRYGWQPVLEDLGSDAALLQRYPWLKTAVEEHRSLVELETVESTRHNSSLRDRTRFYFRSSSVGEDGVSQLQDRIRSSGLCVREPYGDVETLGAWVREDLLAEIERMQPSSRSLSFVEQERRGHEAFAASRRRVYVEHAPTLRKLDVHALIPDKESSSPPASSFIVPPPSLPLVVTGDSGSGKSSLLSYWSHRYRHDHPDAFIVTHHVGATATSTSHLGLLRHVMLEIKDRYGITEEVPTAPEKIESDFRNWLGYASRGGMVLVIDALNQLSASSRRSLKWLPDYFPPYVRVIVSTLDGEVLEQLKLWNWKLLKVKPLTKAEREQVVKGYFKSFGKELDTKNVRRLVADTKSISPLYLVTTLEELRVFGSYEEISNKVGHYLEASDLDDLFQRVLARLEGDYGRNLVREVMGLIWASRNGLSEGEIAEITSCNPLDLARLLHALEFHLLHREGLLGFFHGYLRRGVEKRCLARNSQKIRTWNHLAEFFANEPVTERTSYELIYQYEQLQQWEQLKQALSSIERFIALNQREMQFDLLVYWSRLTQLGYDMAEAFMAEIQLYRQNGATVDAVASVLLELGALFEVTGRWNAAIACFQQTLELHEVPLASLAAAEGGLGGVFMQRGDHADAMTHCERSLSLARDIGERTVAYQALGNLAIIHQHQGDYRQAVAIGEQCLLIGREIGDRRGAARAFGTMGNSFALQNNFPRAMECFVAWKEVSLEIGDRLGLSAAVGNMGNVHHALGEVERALDCHKQHHDIAVELGHQQGLSNALCNMGYNLLEQCQFGTALGCFEQARSIAIKLGDRRLTSVANASIGVLHHRLGNYSQALDYLEAGLTICEAISDRHGVALAFGHMANVYRDLGESQRALQFQEKQRDVAVELGIPMLAGIATGNMGNAYIDLEDFQQALRCFGSALEVHRAMDFAMGMTYWLCGVAGAMLEVALGADEMPPYFQEYIPDFTKRPWRAATLEGAAKLVDECVEISTRLHKPDTLNSAKLLRARLEAAMYRTEVARKLLSELHDEAADDVQRADACYWLWKLDLVGAVPTQAPDGVSAERRSDDEEPVVTAGTASASAKDMSRVPIQSVRLTSFGHLIEALRLYEHLVTQTPKFEYRKRIGELKAAVNPPAEP